MSSYWIRQAQHRTPSTINPNTGTKVRHSTSLKERKTKDNTLYEYVVVVVFIHTLRPEEKKEREAGKILHEYECLCVDQEGKMKNREPRKSTIEHEFVCVR